MAGEFIIDSLLDDFTSNTGTRIDITSQVATTYTEAITTYTLGNKTGLTADVTPEAGAVDGRKIVVPAITDGSVTGTATATHWALTDATSVLLATGPLTSTQAVTSGNTFTLDAIDITIRDATVT
jgi:hypothetical protein